MPLIKASSYVICLISAIKLSKNDLGELLNKLYPARSKWYNLGLALKLSPDDLDAIGNGEYSGKPGDCLREVLKLWLSIATNPEKGDLIKALKAPSVQYAALADELLGWLSSHAPAPVA